MRGLIGGPARQIILLLISRLLELTRGLVAFVWTLQLVGTVNMSLSIRLCQSIPIARIRSRPTYARRTSPRLAALACARVTPNKDSQTQSARRRWARPSGTR